MSTESTSFSRSVPDAGPTDWKGTARYEILRCIGKGGMGVVYEALDRERQQRVALKTLLNSGPAALYLFKQEFRTLADVHHRNLVHLYELVATEADEVFFTMELVNGTDFLTHVQKEGEASAPEGTSAAASTEPTHRERGPLDAAGGSGESARATPVPRESPADFAHLRPALRQLVEGVCALHAAGKLHRDIKPSNVRVTPEGRVVLLDFGVATELSRVVDENLLEDGAMVGTARYMAPEQAVSEPPTPASDWYSVGVMLFEALVGSPPFVGSAFDLLKMKSMLEAPAPGECVRAVPADLDSLCRALLQRDPRRRPSGPEILRQLGAGRSVRAAPPHVAELAAALVGREAQLGALRDAFEATRSGRSITVRLHGQSGMGKSSVVHHFLDELVERGEAVTLRGRAYERESVPYKAVDSVVDALSRYLMHLTEDRADPMTLPPDVWALARLFPVLRRVPKIGEVAEEVVGDPNRVRRRAFLALRDLLCSLARRQPLVVFVDGVQWGDADSAALLLELVRPPDAPPLLLVMTYREEDAKLSPFLIETRARWPPSAEVRDLVVGPLGQEETRRLALALIGSDDASAQLTAEAIAVESGGSPFLAEELARSVSGKHRGTRSEDTSPGIATVTLEQMVKTRLARLPGDARRLLQFVAVAGRPLPLSIVASAAAAVGPVDEALSLLRARRFVRTGLRSAHEVVETIHDRIRDTIVDELSAATLREHHVELARALEAAPDADPEAVAGHLIAAGETKRAARYTERAAEQAAAKLAFDRAADLFRRTIEATPASSPHARRLRMRLAEALEWGGRGQDAARVYLDLAEGAPALERIDLERAAAEQLLASGSIDEGTAVLHRVLSAVGIRAPRSSMSALFWLVFYRVWLTVRGLGFRERDPGEVSREDRVRIDTLYSVGIGFAIVDVVLGACMQARHLLLALRLGDRFQVLRAVSLEAGFLASAGGQEGRRERALSEIGQGLAERSGEPDGPAFHLGTRGASHFLRGRFMEAREELDRAYAMYPRNRAGWQTNVNLFGIEAQLILGDLRDAASRHARLLAEAEEHGDLYTLVNLHTRATPILRLAADDPDTARRHLRQAMSQWSQAGYHVQHWQAMHYEAECDLYSGNGARAYDRVERDVDPLKKSYLLNVQLIRGLTAFLRGRCAIAALDGAPPALRRARLTEARRMAKKLGRERMPWLATFASLVAAAAANAAGDRPRAMAALRMAIVRADSTGMRLHAAAARHQLGSMLGGQEGQSLLLQGEEVMGKAGVRVPARMAARLVPGLWVAGGFGGAKVLETAVDCGDR